MSAAKRRAFYFMPSQTERGNDLTRLREKITSLVAQNAESMVQCAIDAVKDEGQYQAIKYLFEMVGIYPPTAGTESDADDSLARLLLERLGVEGEGAAGTSLQH